MFEIYNRQVQLVLACLPVIAKFEYFALKGGTAINMFIRTQYPRLSVDIDLTYLPVAGRNESLKAIEQGLIDIGEVLKTRLNYKISQSKNPQTQTITKIVVDNRSSKIIIEPNLTLRGTVYPIVHQNSSKRVEELYGLRIRNMPLLDKAELYAGKICAALDRQHPRDLFDIKFILEEGISERTKIAFIVYLLSNNRPLFEILAPNILDQREAYAKEFQGMTDLNISYEELENIREQLIQTIKRILNEQDKQFLISFKKGTPNWDLIKMPQVANLPGIRWKLMNIVKMDRRKATEYLAKLEAVLYAENTKH
jgi:predicted nucleotidyltransferase component of viral defense system